jgi:DNA ligase-associated metallophosphoesterase
MMRFLKKQLDSSLAKRGAPPDLPTVRLVLGGIELVPDLTGALYVPDYRALLVADLHFEKGSSFLNRGLHIPPYDTRSTLTLLEGAVARLKPHWLIALGDSFHDTSAAERIDAGDLRRIRNLSNHLDVCWLIGNHDPELPPDLGGRIAVQISLGPLTLRHLPRARLDSENEIAGHLHPVASISGRGRRLTSRSFVADPRRLIMPAFGAYAGGLNVSAPEIASLFPGHFTAWMIGRNRIYGFSSSLLD